MCPEVLGGDELAGPALDVLTRDGVGHVRGPEALDPLDDPEVDPATSPGAGLPHDMRVTLPEIIKERVERHVLCMGRRGPTVGRAAWLEEVPVVVPLDVVDRELGQDGGDLVPQVLPHLGIGQVEDQLAAVQQRHPAFRGEDPLGVLPVQSGVGVDHLGLEPEPELQTQAVDVVDEGGEAVRPHVVIDPPVAEARCVVSSSVEPAVVQHEPFGAHLGGQLGDALEPFEAVVEIHSLPDVEGHRLLRRMRRKGALPGVQRLCRRVEAGTGCGEDHPGHRVGVAGHQHDLAGKKQLAPADGRPRRPAALHADHGVAAARHGSRQQLTLREPEPAGARNDNTGPVQARLSPT